MKVQVTLDLNVTMGNVSHDNTGCRGYLPEGTRYEDIVRIFDCPLSGKSLDNKIKVEWIGKINGLVFTIYDYKSKVEPEWNTDWHIGGRVKLAADLVNAYFHFNMLKGKD